MILSHPGTRPETIEFSIRYQIIFPLYLTKLLTPGTEYSASQSVCTRMDSRMMRVLYNIVLTMTTIKLFLIST